MFTVGPVHARDHGHRVFRCMVTEPAARPIRRDLLYALIRIQEEGASTPLGRLEAHRSDRIYLVVQHTYYHCKHEHILIAACFPRPDASGSFYELLD